MIDANNYLDIITATTITNQLVWYKNDGTGGFDSEVVIDATQRQAYTFTFADFDIDGDLDIASIAYADDRVNIFNNQFITLGLEEADLESISIYPNPTKDILNFKGFNNNFTISIFDALGKLVANKTLEINHSIDVSDLASGIYLIKFENSKSIFKFIKE